MSIKKIFNISTIFIASLFLLLTAINISAHDYDNVYDEIYNCKKINHHEGVIYNMGGGLSKFDKLTIFEECVDNNNNVTFYRLTKVSKSNVKVIAIFPIYNVQKLIIYRR